MIGVYTSTMDDINPVIEKALAILRRKSIDGYEVYLHQSTHFDVESKDGKVDTLHASQSLGMAFRILNRQRMGFSYTTSPHPSVSAQKDSPGGLEQMIEDATSSSEATSSDPCFDFASLLKDPLPELPICDESLVGVSEKAKIEKAKLLEEAARSVDPGRIKMVRKASYQDVLSRTTLINSNGLHVSYTSTLASVSVTAIAEESGASEVGWDFDYSHFFNDLDPEKVGREAGRMALERLGGKRIPSRIYPVLLRNHVASEFLSLLAYSFCPNRFKKENPP